MEGKKIVTQIILLNILFSLIYIAPTTKAEQHYIHPTDSIQEIINTIQPNSTIILLPGIYNETFTIHKPLTITSIDPKLTHIITTTDTNKPAISITSSNVTIEKLTIQNNADGLYATGIRILHDTTIIRNCIFQNTPIGLSIWSNANILENNYFYNCTDEGIVLLSTTFSTAHKNIIRNSTFENNCDAIELQQSSYNIIQNCTMINNTHSGIDAIDKNNNYNIIKDCIIQHNSVHGIYFTHSKANIIQNCTFLNNTDGNILMIDSIDTITQSNTLLNKSSFHINSITSANDPDIEENEKKENVIQLLRQLLRQVRTMISTLVH